MVSSTFSNFQRAYQVEIWCLFTVTFLEKKYIRIINTGYSRGFMVFSASATLQIFEVYYDTWYMKKSSITNVWPFLFCHMTKYSVVSIKRTGSLNYFGVFSHPVLFFHVLKKNFAPPCSFFHVLKKNFAPPCSLITSCSLNRYYRVLIFKFQIQ